MSQFQVKIKMIHLRAKANSSDECTINVPYN